MKSIKNIFLFGSLLLLLMLTSCSSLQDPSKEASETQEKAALQNDDSLPTQEKPAAPATLPVQYQTPAYIVGQESKEELSKSEDTGMKVGATIKSTRGPQPLWDIMKRLAAIKNMNISWASDVDQRVLVDVDINASDDYNEALSNLLRQVDYFHEIEGNTIVVKFKETRQFHIAMPFTKQIFSTGTGGNVLGNKDTSNNVDGTIELKSKDNEFDIWDNIKLNLDTLLEIWTFRREGETVKKGTDTTSETSGARTYSKQGTEASTAAKSSEQDKEQGVADSSATSNISGGKGYYLIDKPVGLITVTAPRSILEKIDNYIKTLKKSLYQQISIEAKIIEVQLTDNSSIGINWSQVLKDFSVDGAIQFGSNALGGQIYPFVFADEEGTNGVQDNGDGTHQKIHDPTRFVSKVSINPQNFGVFLNALKEQGDTTVLSNPKISVMNGQPALITVGRNVTYIDNIESELDSDTGIITYTVNTERILSGVGMALTATVLDKNEIILNLVPVTSELEEPIAYKDVGTLGATVGLPIVNVREISTIVRVKNGEMLVIGGLISDTKDTEGKFAPVVGSIPLVKYLFGHEVKTVQKRELIILLKPSII